MQLSLKAITLESKTLAESHIKQQKTKNKPQKNCVSQLKVVATGFLFRKTKYRIQGNKQKVILL